MENIELLQSIRLIIKEELQPVNERLDGIDGRLDGIDSRLDGMDVRLDSIDSRLDGMDVRLDNIDSRLDGMDVRLDNIDSRLGIIEYNQNEDILVLLNTINEKVEKCATKEEVAALARLQGEQFLKPKPHKLR
ncbi:MAG TPA: hypothetical protein VGE40_07355 [Bacilli bacterium]